MGKDQKHVFDEAIRATQVFKRKIKQVAGERGLLHRLNEAHIASLSELTSNLGNQKRARALVARTSTVISREEKVICASKDGLSAYRPYLEAVEREASAFFKRKIIKDIVFVQNVALEIEAEMEKLMRRIEDERKIISVTGRIPVKDEIERLISVLKKEHHDIKKTIRKCKPRKLYILKTLYLGIKNSQSASLIKELLETDDFDDLGKDDSGTLRPVYETAGNGSSRRAIEDMFGNASEFKDPPPHPHLFKAAMLVTLILAGCLETLFMLLVGLTLDNRQLRSEIKELKKLDKNADI